MCLVALVVDGTVWWNCWHFPCSLCHTDCWRYPPYCTPSSFSFSFLLFLFFNVPSPCLVLLSTEHRGKKGEGIGVCWPQCKCCETMVAILTIMWYWRVRSGGWRQLTWAPRHVTRALAQPSQLGCELSCDWPACLRLILTAARNAFCDVFAAPCFVRLIKSIILHTFYE